MISEFDQYMIEGFIILVLSKLYSVLGESTQVRLATLIEQLENTVREEALLARQRRNPLSSSKSEKNTTEKDKKRMYTIGSLLTQLVIERDFIKIVKPDGSTKVKKSKGGSYYKEENLFAVCNLDMSLLPVKVNLPMICKPLDWSCSNSGSQSPRTLSDLSGGYLSTSCTTGQIYNRYRLLSSDDYNHFYIILDNNYRKLCSVMNKLQGQAFQINSKWLQFLQI